LLALGGIDHCWISSPAAAAADRYYYAFGLLLPAAKLLSSLLPPTASKSLSPFYFLTRIWMFPSTKTALPNSSHKKGKKENPVKEQSFLGTLRERSNFTYSTREEGQC
jgi:hypothetical protein